MPIINPRIDFAFKKLFGSEENKASLIEFINAVVDEKDWVQVYNLMKSFTKILNNPFF